MGWPQYVVITLMAVGSGISLAKHGEARSPHNFSIDLIATALMVGLLYAGGFFGR